MTLGEVLLYEQPTKYIVKNTTYDESYLTPVLTAGQSFLLGYTDETENIYSDLPCIIFDDFTTSIQFVDFPFKVKSSAMKILTADSNVNDIRYLYYKLSTIKVDTELHKRYWISQYMPLNIQIPPLPKQQKIAAILDKACELISERKKQLELIDLLVKSRFVEMFGDPVTNPMGWEVKRLDQIADSRLGKMLDTKRQTGKSNYPYLANFNVQWFSFDLSELKEMDFDERDRVEFALKYGDLLVCEGGEVGRTAIWKNEIENCFFQKAIHRVRCYSDIAVPEYLSWVMYNKAKKTNFDGLITSATIAHLTGIKLKSLKIQVPPIELQNKFADFVRTADKLKLEVEQGIEKLELLYKALMQEYFG